MGCKAFTPPLVGLASELEGRPFHLVASHNQRGDAQHAKHEIFQNGLPVDTTNVSVTKSAGHPGVTGTGYVPYYMVFDHHGDLVHHHQGGPYHGGDGTAVLDRVRAMLADVPAVYVGKEPFERHAKLAKEIASGKKLGRAAQRLAAALDAAPDDEELARLGRGVERYVARTIAGIEARLAVEPSKAFKDLDAAARALAETPWGAPLAEFAQGFGERAERKRHDVAAKALATAMKRWRKLEPVRGNRGSVLNPLDDAFRKDNAKALRTVVELLREAADGADDLPAGRRARTLLDLLQG